MQALRRSYTVCFFQTHTLTRRASLRQSADDLTLLRGILAPPTSVDHVRGRWLYSLHLSAISHTLKLRSSRILETKPWLVHITPVPLGTCPPADMIAGELIVKHSDPAKVTCTWRSARCRAVGTWRPRYTLLLNRWAFSCQTFTVPRLMVPKVVPLRGLKWPTRAV